MDILVVETKKKNRWDFSPGLEDQLRDIARAEFGQPNYVLSLEFFSGSLVMAKALQTPN